MWTCRKAHFHRTAFLSSLGASIGRIGLLRLSPATARIVSTVFALARRCGLFPGIGHRRPVVGCCCQGKLLRRFIVNIEYHVVLLRCSIQFLRLLNDSDVGKPSDPDLLHLTFGPRLFSRPRESGVGYHKSSLRGDTRAGIAPGATGCYHPAPILKASEKLWQASEGRPATRTCWPKRSRTTYRRRWVNLRVLRSVFQFLPILVVGSLGTWFAAQLWEREALPCILLIIVAAVWIGAWLIGWSGQYLAPPEFKDDD